MINSPNELLVESRPGLVAQIGDGQAVARRQRVFAGQQHMQQVAGQRDQRVVLVLLVRRHRQVVDHRHVDLPGAQGAQAFLWLQLHHHHFQAWIGSAQGAHGFRHHGHGDRGKGRHAQFAGDLAA